MNSNLRITPENELILLCSIPRINNKSKDRIKNVLTSDFNWDYFIKKVTDHKLKPLIYLNLKNFENSIPNRIYDDLKISFRQNTQKNLFLTCELIKIIEMFEKHKIPVISYKGPILTYLTYGNLSMRHFVDLDLLVNPEHVNQAQEILYSMGYKLDLKINEKQKKKLILQQQELKFFNKCNTVAVDLHWKLSLLHSVKTSCLSKKTKTVEIFNKPIKTLQPEEMFLLICIHNSSHRWNKLSFLLDLSDFALNNGINWFKVVSLAKKMGLMRIVNINLILIKNILNLNLFPENFIEGDKDKIAVNIVHKFEKKIRGDVNSLNLAEELFSTIVIRDNIMLGLQDVITNLFRPTSYEWRKIPLPAKITFLYVIIRPFLLLFRYGI